MSRKQINRAFRKRGLTLRGNAAKELGTFLKDAVSDEISHQLDTIAARVKELNPSANVIDRQAVC
jgi:DNA polymerases epsilon N terminal